MFYEGEARPMGRSAEAISVAKKGEQIIAKRYEIAGAFERYPPRERLNELDRP